MRAEYMKRTPQSALPRLHVSMGFLLTRGWALGTHLRLLGTQVGINANIVVGELSHLSIIDANDLGLLRSAKSEAWDEVHDPKDDGGHDERVAEASAAVGELVAQLDVVAIWPASRDLGEAVEVGDISLGEEGGEKVADDSANTMGGEDIERVVVAEDKLEFRGKVAHGASNNTKGDGGGGANETRAWGDSDETDDSSGAEADGGPLLLETVIL